MLRPDCSSRSRGGPRACGTTRWGPTRNHPTASLLDAARPVVPMNARGHHHSGTYTQTGRRSRTRERAALTSRPVGPQPTVTSSSTEASSLHTYVSAIVVDRDRRLRGIGRRLLGGITAAAAEANAGFLVLVPQDGDAADNAPAAFFEACGLVTLEAHTKGAPTRYGASTADILRLRTSTPSL